MRNYDSKGMQFVRQFDEELSDQSINTIIDDPNWCDITIDDKTKSVHKVNAPYSK